MKSKDVDDCAWLLRLVFDSETGKKRYTERCRIETLEVSTMSMSHLQSSVTTRDKAAEHWENNSLTNESTCEVPSIIKSACSLQPIGR